MFTAVVLLALILTACAQNPSPQRSIQLRGNMSKGYAWDYDAEKDEIVFEVDRAYRDGNVPGTTDAPGLFVFTFEGREPGETKLYFHYVDPNDEEEKPMSTVVYSVEVDPGGNISRCEPIGTFLDVEGVERLKDIVSSRMKEKS